MTRPHLAAKKTFADLISAAGVAAGAAAFLGQWSQPDPWVGESDRSHSD